MTFDVQGIGMTSRRTRERLVGRLQERGISEPRVLEALSQVPRHIFVDEALAHRAYEETALPIGHGQTISQPFVVALMTQTLFSRAGRNGLPSGWVPRGRVLEIGTGSGYQTAVLAMLTRRVFSVERIEALHKRARPRFQALRLSSTIRSRLADGHEGWRSEGPFDGILVTAAPAELPEALSAQLAPGGRLVAPVGDSVQELMVIDREEEGLRRFTTGVVRFVPLQPGIAR